MEEEYYEFSSDDENAACVSRFYSSGSESDDENNDDFFQNIMQHHASKSKNFSGPSGDVQPDPFEEEMAYELNAAMLALKSFGNTSSSSANPQSSRHCENLEDSSRAPSASQHPEGQYESIYFDSDEDEDREEVKKHRKTMSDADLLYDSELDDQDQLWMNEHRQRYSAGREGAAAARSKKSKSDGDGLPQSDAVLNCPGCLSMLCTDCQRHVTYGNQYRAMFVFNCRVDRTQLLSCPMKLTKSEIKKNKKKERQLRKMMKKRGNQFNYVAAGAPVSAQIDPDVVAGNLSNEEPDNKNHQALGDAAAFHRSDPASNDGSSTPLNSRPHIDIETMDVVEAPTSSVNGTQSAREVSKSGSSSNIDVPSGTSCGTSAGINDSVHQSDMGDKHSVLPDENVPNNSSANSSISLDKGTSCLQQNTSCASFTTDHPLAEKVSANKSNYLNQEATSVVEKCISNESSEGSAQTTVGGELKRSSSPDSSSPLKKVRFSEEARELGPANPGDVLRGAELLQSAPEDVFHPVLCRHCNTKVAVFDKDEVYHFFNVITSY